MRKTKQKNKHALTPPSPSRRCIREPMRVTTYKFDQKFLSYDMEQLLADLFNDPIVLAGETS